MNDQKLISKLNESFLLETSLLNAYQSIGEIVKDANIRELLSNNSDITKEILASLNNLVEKLNGEFIDNLSEIAFTVNDAAESLVNSGSLTPNEDLRFLDEILILENLSKSNIAVLSECAEKTNDERVMALKDIKDKVKSRRKSLKELSSQMAINELMED